MSPLELFEPLLWLYSTDGNCSPNSSRYPHWRELPQIQLPPPQPRPANTLRLVSCFAHKWSSHSLPVAEVLLLRPLQPCDPVAIFLHHAGNAALCFFRALACPFSRRINH